MLKEGGSLLVVDGKACYIASQAPALAQPNNGAVAGNSHNARYGVNNLTP